MKPPMKLTRRSREERLTALMRLGDQPKPPAANSAAPDNSKPAA